MEQTPIYLGERCRKAAEQIWWLFSERPACKVGCWQACGTWNLGRFISFPELLLTVPKLFVQNNTVYAKQLLSSWESRVWYVSHRDTAPSKNLGTELPWQITFHPCCHNLLLGELSIPCVTSIGENPGSLSLVFPVLCSMHLSLHWFCFVFFELE